MTPKTEKRDRPRDGIIAGYVLKLARESANLTQPALAADLEVDTHTLQSWESGRRSISAINVRDFVQLKMRLLNNGANPAIVRAMDSAASADYILSEILDLAADVVTSETHTLANWLIPSDISGMLGWPLTGSPPPTLRHISIPPRRGPVPSAPFLTSSEKRRFYSSLRSTADRINESRITIQGQHGLFVHQAYFRIGWDNEAESRDWLAAKYRHLTARTAALSQFGPNWLAARAIVIALASQGDPEPLRYFLRSGHESEAQETANLNYWAYWVGEIEERQSGERFMTDRDIFQSWTGDKLLLQLASRLSTDSNYPELHIHTICRLLDRSITRQFMEHDRVLNTKINELINHFKDISANLSNQAQRELDTIHSVIAKKVIST